MAAKSFRCKKCKVEQDVLVAFGGYGELMSVYKDEHDYCEEHFNEARQIYIDKFVKKFGRLPLECTEKKIDDQPDETTIGIGSTDSEESIDAGGIVETSDDDVDTKDVTEAGDSDNGTGDDEEEKIDEEV
jgi:hypothetical protein